MVDLPNPYAQTHLQLYWQLADAGCSPAGLQAVDRAYRLAMRVCAGFYRPNNKPFIAHLIGVASVLARFEQDVDLVCAGLLHSVYTSGFRCRRGHVPRRLRQRVGEHCNPRVEALAHAYHEHRWTAAEFQRVAAQGFSARGTGRDLLILKMADIMEECVDSGHLYAPEKQHLPDAGQHPDWWTLVAEAAMGVGLDAMASELRRLRAQALPPAHPALCGTAVSSHGLRAPRSGRGRWRLRLRNRLGII